MKWVPKPPEPGDGELKIFYTADTDEHGIEFPLELQPIIFMFAKKNIIANQLLTAEDVSIYPMDYISESEQESLK